MKVHKQIKTISLGILDESYHMIIRIDGHWYQLIKIREAYMAIDLSSNTVRMYNNIIESRLLHLWFEHVEVMEAFNSFEEMSEFILNQYA